MANRDIVGVYSNRRIERATIAYMAGVFDGEGNVCLRRAVSKKPNRSPQYNAACCVTNNDKELIDLFARNFGGSVMDKGVRSANHRKTWIWSVSGREMDFFIKCMTPFCRTKLSRLCLAANFRETQGSPDMSKGRVLKGEKEHQGRQWCYLVHSLQDQYYETMKKLNARLCINRREQKRPEKFAFTQQV